MKPTLWYFGACANSRVMKLLRAPRPNIVSLAARNCQFVARTLPFNGWHVLGRNTFGLTTEYHTSNNKKVTFSLKKIMIVCHIISPTPPDFQVVATVPPLHCTKETFFESIPETEHLTPSSQELQDWHRHRKQTRYTHLQIGNNKSIPANFQETSNGRTVFWKRQLSRFRPFPAVSEPFWSLAIHNPSHFHRA